MNKISEIIPDDMPQWAWNAFNEGQFFRVCIKKVEELEELVHKLKETNSED